MLPLISHRNKTPWYLRGGITRANGLAAYQSKGVGSYASSKIKLAHPGMNDLSNGAAFPSWEAVNGWTFADGSSQYLTIASALATAVPLSMICRFNADTDVLPYMLMTICDTAAKSFFGLYAAGNVALDPISARANLVAVDGIANSSTGFTSGNWFTGAAVLSANNARTAYINGGSKITNATNVTPAGLDTTYIGTYFDGAARGYFLDGKISTCAFYNIALSDAQVLALHNAMIYL